VGVGRTALEHELLQLLLLLLLVLALHQPCWGRDAGQRWTAGTCAGGPTKTQGAGGGQHGSWPQLRVPCKLT